VSRLITPRSPGPPSTFLCDDASPRVSLGAQPATAHRQFDDETRQFVTYGRWAESVVVDDGFQNGRPWRAGLRGADSRQPKHLKNDRAGGNLPATPNNKQAKNNGR
jgi:hypothetical protein